MKRIILLVIILIFLTGCGICNLNYFTVPDDLEFIALIEELDTPRKISCYMIDNFTYEKHDSWTPDPYILWKTKKGDCNDFVTFGIFIAHWHDYKTYQILISYKDTTQKHHIAIYVEDNGLSFSDCQIHSFYLKKTYFNTFEEVVKFNCEYYPDKELKGYIVYDYWNDEVEEVYNE